MCLFFESIKVLQGKAVNLDLHEDRLNRTRSEFLGLTEKLSLQDLIQADVQSLQKSRVIYKEKIEKIEIAPYIPRKIKHLKIVTANEIQYNYKFLDRSCFKKLLSGCPPDSDILIIKNKEITDTSYANIAFWDGSKWLTPANPLLSGVKRQFLMNRGSIFPADIRLNDLHLFKHAVMINAMLDLEDSPVIDLRNIR